MRIEISNLLKSEMSESDWNLVGKLARKYINGNFLISTANDKKQVVLECVSENDANKMKESLANQYEVELLEDCFMAEIDLMDMLSGGLW